MSNGWKSLLTGGLFSLAALAANAAETVGEAVLIRTSVTGDGRTLAEKSPVYRDERLKTSASGLGEFVFRDGTKFAIGLNSSIVIDKFVYGGGSSFKDLTISAAKGSFRWISGGSPSSAYKINTPAGTIGIRGTALDVYVGKGGVTAVVLLSGVARFCGRSGCQELTRRCDYVVATPRGGITRPSRVNQGVLRQVSNVRALPFMTGDQQLSRRFRTGDSCGLSSSISTTPSGNTQRGNVPGNPPGPGGGGGNSGGGGGGGNTGGTGNSGVGVGNGGGNGTGNEGNGVGPGNGNGGGSGNSGNSGVGAGNGGGNGTGNEGNGNGPGGGPGRG
ncbi:FecR family protein [Aquibium carbonis]|uniref:FecR family protein n=1 Tax=Aquibium carbonis TaxID=2495581 RepID=UPI001AEC7FB2|nr:FecR domain-containing protein [Aquibium carbonis]